MFFSIFIERKRGSELYLAIREDTATLQWDPHHPPAFCVLAKRTDQDVTMAKELKWEKRGKIVFLASISRLPSSLLPPLHLGYSFT